MGNKEYLEVSPKIISIHFPSITPTVVGVILKSTSACFAMISLPFMSYLANVQAGTWPKVYGKT